MGASRRRARATSRAGRADVDRVLHPECPATARPADGNLPSLPRQEVGVGVAAQVLRPLLLTVQSAYTLQRQGELPPSPAQGPAPH
eukprot:CAMPEP_0179852134 /NCGR_PEP_ID=MMETSP0982-20121206/8632_1 /TAXON_ID=483367 /ORGANISM="non described non described, Strain CCMP 2436" /LENGTH=85 /DNA_ID=CAMNT_0021737721 /DNA_START=106 /DNA_END=363 /DNA_ORIENTATION=+